MRIRQLVNGSIVVWLLSAGCGAATGPVSRSPLSPLEPARLAEVEAYSPELADLVVRLRRASDEESAAGRTASAERLSHFSNVALLGALELVARSEAAEREAAVLRELSTPTVIASPPDDAPTEAEPPPARRRSRARERQAAPEEAPPAPAEPDPVSDEDGRTAAVRARLSELAARLSDVQTTERNRVEFDSVQSSLIEADRALSEGLTGRASELADAAARQLAGLTGTPPPSGPVEAPHGLIEDARRELGGRAIIRGRLIAIRLDSFVSWRDGAWHVRAGHPLDALRALARTYRDTRIIVGTVGNSEDPNFRAHGEALVPFLHRRLQVAQQRIVWRPEMSVTVPDGTYVALRGSASE